MKEQKIQETKEIITSHIIEPLLAWYRETRRLLPWRATKDPYRIWISEIMLQQTRIEAVIPYYHRFLSELPTVQALAEVPDDRLMKLWEGLGYYSRARNLKKAAIQIMEEHGGNLPEDFPRLRKLSGIGDYTAGAIASIAFGKPEPAVDGNVLRVIMRLCGRDDDIALPATKKTVTEWLRAMYPKGEDAGDLTEGLMELGEKICIPAGIPKCAECPLRKFCVANRKKLQTELPKKSPKKERRYADYTVLILHCDGKYALCKRPTSGLLAGLWEFPNCVEHRSEDEVREWLQNQGVIPVSIHPCGKATHIFTHVTWNMVGMTVECQNQADTFTWFSKEEILNHTAIPTAFRYFVQQLSKEYDK